MKEARWRKSWWKEALEKENTLISRIVDLWAEGLYDMALSLAKGFGVEEDVSNWPVIDDSDPNRGKPRVGRWEECYGCEGAGGFLPRWVSQAIWWDPPEDPYNFFEPCVVCDGTGKIWEPQPTCAEMNEDIYEGLVYGPWTGEVDGKWVASYRSYRQAGLSPEEAKQLAWENLYDQIRKDFPPDKPLPF